MVQHSPLHGHRAECDSAQEQGESGCSLATNGPLGEGVVGHEGTGTGRDDEDGESKLTPRGHWKPAEDAKLRELVAQHGPKNWKMIATKLEGRTGKSCRLRWLNQLDPRIIKREFSEQEEEKLLDAHRMYGNKWALIASFFPGRTDNYVKNQWRVLTARKQRAQQGNGSWRRRNAFTILPADLAAQQQSFTSLLGSDGMLTAPDNECHGWKFDHSNSPVVSEKSADLSGFSGVTGEHSAAASVVDQRIFSFPHGENVSDGDEIRLAFIDFLGVGTDMTKGN